MKETFEDYLKQARIDFGKVAAKYTVDKHLELRTAIDSLLIAYDQATKQALNIADVSTTVNCEKWQHDLKRELNLNDNCELCGEKL